MLKQVINFLAIVLVTFLFTVPMDASPAEVGPADLTGEDKEHFDRFRELLQYGAPDDFYSYTAEYGKELKGKGYMMLYYKMKNNEGFYALRHNMIYRAMRAAEELDTELRKLGAKDYYYLATGLLGDIYYVCHDRAKAEHFFTQSLTEVGDKDPKFTMRVYQSLAELLCIKDSRQALAYMEKSVALAKATDNVEYLSLSLAMIAYINFLEGDKEGFYQYEKMYENLRATGRPGFSHRYDNIMEVARLSFEGKNQQALDKLKEGSVYVDSSLVAIRIFTMEGDVDKGFGAIKRRSIEMDSVHSLAQNSTFDQLASERSQMQSREELQANKKMVKRMIMWMAALAVIVLLLYIIERRYLFRKLRQRGQALKTALEHAQESDRMKSAFINNVSHEIRTPLNAVSGFSQILCQPGIDLSEEEKQDMMERISNNVELITSIVNELLELSKVESESYQRPEEELEEVMINPLCRGVLRSVAFRSKEGVETRFSTNVADDFAILTHPATVKRILTHLLDNAQKFTEEGHIALRCQLDPDKAVINIIVTDTGIGIPEADQERIFEVFEKVNGNFKEGIGLGLPICRRLACSIDGSVTIDPSYKVGSRFVLSIPVKE